MKLFTLKSQPKTKLSMLTASSPINPALSHCKRADVSFEKVSSFPGAPALKTTPTCLSPPLTLATTVARATVTPATTATVNLLALMMNRSNGRMCQTGSRYRMELKSTELQPCPQQGRLFVIARLGITMHIKVVDIYLDDK